MGWKCYLRCIGWPINGGPKHEQPATTPADAYQQISQWNRRKENLFTREHVGVAWEWFLPTNVRHISE